MMRRLLSEKQLAELFGISERTLDRWREEGIIDAIRVDGIVRFCEEAVDAALVRMSNQTLKTGRRRRPDQSTVCRLIELH